MGIKMETHFSLTLLKLQTLEKDAGYFCTPLF